MINQLIRRLVIFLIRKKLKLKKMEAFQFAGQKSVYDYYFFEDYEIIKVEVKKGFVYRQSGVSLNYLLSDHCKIVKTGEFE